MVQIQKINAHDFAFWCDQVAELFNSSVKINFPEFMVNGNYGNDKCNEVATFLKDGTAIVFVAIEQDKLIGWIWCHKINRLDRMRLHIAEIAVFDDYQKRGVGSQLLDKVEECAIENGYFEIDLLVTASNISAVRFYEESLYRTERYLMKKDVKRRFDN